MGDLKHLSVHQWIRSAICESQQPTLPIGFLLLKLPPPPCAVLLVYKILTVDFGVKVFCNSFHSECLLLTRRGCNFFVLFVLTFLQLNSCLFLQCQVAFFLGSAAVQGQACLHLMHRPAKNHNARNQIKVQIFRNSKTRTCIIHALNLSWKLMSTGCPVWQGHIWSADCTSSPSALKLLTNACANFGHGTESGPRRDEEK